MCMCVKWHIKAGGSPQLDTSRENIGLKPLYTLFMDLHPLRHSTVSRISNKLIYKW